MNSEERLKQEQEEREKKRGTPHKIVAVSGYGVPRPTVLPPPRKIPEDLPVSIVQWLSDKGQ